MSLGEEVNVVSDAPGPHSMRAWKPGEGSVACGMVGGLQTQMQRQTQFQQSTACAWWCFVDAVGGSGARPRQSFAHAMTLSRVCPRLGQR